MGTVRRLACLSLATSFALAATSFAQPLGTYKWQLEPYCNILTLMVVQQGGQYQLDGIDDQCGAGQAASARGMAFQNLNGTIGFGLTVVTTPGGTPVHIDATISFPGLNGTWRDSVGNSGNLIFGAGIPGGSLRPVPAGGLAPASVTNVQIANNVIGAAQINAAQVQQRVGGNCGAQAIAAINENGTVVCTTVAQHVFSGYRTPAASQVELFLDMTVMKSYILNEPLITQSVIDTGQVQVWLRFGSDEVPLPYTSMAGGTANTIWARPEVGGIRIYRMTHGCTTSGCLIGLPALEYRFAFLTGGSLVP